MRVCVVGCGAVGSLFAANLASLEDVEVWAYDLAQAHVLAIGWLMDGGASEALNVGTGSGYSVREVVRAVEEVTGQKVPYVAGPRRDGDPPELVADSSRLRRTLKWTPKHSELREIVSSAWNFERRRRQQAN